MRNESRCVQAFTRDDNTICFSMFPKMLKIYLESLKPEKGLRKRLISNIRNNLMRECCQMLFEDATLEMIIAQKVNIALFRCHYGQLCPLG